jgi:hypothetical protein
VAGALRQRAEAGHRAASRMVMKYLELFFYVKYRINVPSIAPRVLRGGTRCHVKIFVCENHGFANFLNKIKEKR